MHFTEINFHSDNRPNRDLIRFHVYFNNKDSKYNTTKQTASTYERKDRIRNKAKPIYTKEGNRNRYKLRQIQ